MCSDSPRRRDHRPLEAPLVPTYPAARRSGAPTARHPGYAALARGDQSDCSIGRGRRSMFPPPPPWKLIGHIDPEREYLGFTSRFFIKSLRTLPDFVALSQRIRKQATVAPGVVGWSLAADLPKLEFFTL